MTTAKKILKLQINGTKMKKLFIISLLLLSGCVVQDPYYHNRQPVYVQPGPVYIAPPPPRCHWAQQWNGYTRTYQSVRVCR